MIAKKNLAICSLIIILCILNPVSTQEDNFHRCQDGVVVTDSDYCPNVMHCPDGLFRSNSYTCSYEHDFTPQSKCE